MQYRTSIGLDVHARSISACAFNHLTGEISEKQFVECVPQDIADWASRFDAPMRAVYETGPTGFVLARALNDAGLECVLGATSKMLRPSGDRQKNDKRDALFLARMLATNNIPVVRVPGAEEEAARDLVRQREDAREMLTRAKLRLTHFLMRKGHVYEKGKKSWTQKYVKWLSTLKFETTTDKETFEEFYADVLYARDRKERIQRRIEAAAEDPRWKPMVQRLRCMKGVSTYTALVFAVEVGDFSRFPNARAFQSYLGLIPSESSSGEGRHTGPITKTGNQLARKLLTESSWFYLRDRVTIPYVVEEVPPEVAEHARKGANRLKTRARHLQARGKKGNVVNIAVARELAGWLWALAVM